MLFARLKLNFPEKDDYNSWIAKKENIKLISD
jgi:hypothetical protein